MTRIILGIICVGFFTGCSLHDLGRGIGEGFAEPVIQNLGDWRGQGPTAGAFSPSKGGSDRESGSGPPIDWWGIAKEVGYGATILFIGALAREYDPRRRRYVNGKK